MALVVPGEYQDREMIVPLKIPNEEIRQILRKSVRDWFQKTIRTVDRTEIFQAFWDGDTDAAQNNISDLLFASISYHVIRKATTMHLWQDYLLGPVIS